MAISLITSDKYWGTKITGTSTTAKTFPKSGLGWVPVNSTYVNPATGHNYKCTTEGYPSQAKWKYIKTDIVMPPSLTVTNLGAPTRATVGSGTHFMDASWKVPKALTDSKKGDRATKLAVKWTVTIPGKNNDLNVEKEVGISTVQSQINLSNLRVGSRTYTRASFWPLTTRKLTRVTVSVRSKNTLESGNYAKATRDFVKPKAPAISGFTFNSENGEVSATITTDPGNGYAERYDTHYKVYVTDTRTGKSWVATDNTSTATSITAAYDVSDYQQLTYGQYVKVTVSAWARGYAGNSDVVSRSYYVSYPAAATIKSAEITSKSSSGRCIARISTNSTEAHPVDVVKLEYLANCEYATAASIPGTASWSDSGVQDDAQCSALTMPVTELIPEAGNYTWIRVKTYHANEAVLLRYSNYLRLKALETPAETATDERITILSATAGEDGRSAVVHLGWNKTGTDDATGTELSWSEDSDAWRSTEEPDSYTFTWSDGSVTSGGVTYRDSATITIKNLEEATKYYIRARRYLDGDTMTYSPYSNQKTCLTSEAPEAVSATCDRYVPFGQPLPVRWTFAGNSTQKEWQIVSNGGKVIANGRGSAGSAKISANRLKSVATGGAPIVPTTKSGSIVTFDADEDTVISSLKVSITPKQAGSGDPSPSNVRPISGWTDADVTVTGENVWGGQPFADAFLNTYSNRTYVYQSSDADGEFINYTPYQAGGFVLFDKFKPNTRYTFIARAKGTNLTAAGTVNLLVKYTDGAVDYISSPSMTGSSYATFAWTSAVNKSIQYIRGVWANGGAKFYLDGTGLFEGVLTTADFEPYTGHTTPVPLGQTVYGGMVDPISGELKITQVGVDLSSLSWSGSSVKVSSSILSVVKKPSGNNIPANVIAEKYKTSAVAPIAGNDGKIGVGADGRVQCGSNETPSGLLVYELATPTTTQLTPAQVATLLGTNNVWSVGDVTLKYGHKSTGSVTFNVRVSSGSGFVASEDHTVTIIDPPSLNITAPSQMTAQPYSFTASCTTVSDLIVIVTSSGAMGQYPDGVKMQTAGDTIYSERISPEWTESNDEFTTTITLPTGLDFWDGVNYNMTVTAVDRTTNLRSDEMQATFGVNWAHKAVDPENFVTVTPVDEVTEDGVRRLAVDIALTAPTGSTSTDVYDIYRMDGGTARLIGEGFPLTHTTTDEYAPIGEGQRLYYRVALRTVDGDVSFADIEYDLPVDTLRLDWRDGSIELPYNITVGDGYTKSVDLRDHMDGSVDGYWNPNIARKSSLSTDVIPVEQAADIEMVRRLARYAGPVFVRTPNGGAFEADVQITNLSANNAHVANIAIDANEIGLTQEFILPTPFEL